MKHLLYLSIILVFIDGITSLASGRRNQLNNFIKHYEELNYDRNDLISRHLRMRRSIEPHQQLHLNFHSHGRYFPIRLKRDTTIFSEEFSVPHGEHSFHPANIYLGWLEGDTGSKVHGFIHDNIFEGKIYTSYGKEFHIEPAWKYLNNSKSHSVIYDVDNIHYPYPHGAGCGINRGLKDWMKNIQNSSKVDEKDDKHLTFQSNEESYIHRVRRATTPKTSCRLYVQADWKFTDSFAKSVDRALYLMTQYVSSVNHIYEKTKFTNYPHNVSFAISRMKAQTQQQCNADANCKFKDPNIGVAKFLELNSETNHDEHCLAYVFTYRDFDDGVLGLAWIAETSGASGGVCERWKAYSGGKYKSLNTGVVTTLNYQQDVPTKVTEITLAHEIGHNFGSQHDPLNDATCSPGSGGGGNFIMYPRATSGSDTNNYKFSQCSRNFIGPVLNAKADICFKVPTGPICGNKIVEAGEECDCGYGDECKADPCCEEQKSGNSNNCKYSAKANAVGGSRCSPSEGPCCDGATCAFKASNSSECSKDSECAFAARCDGSSAKCPTPPARPDVNTTCQNGMKVCLNGSCIGSICLKTNETSCMCNTEQTYCDICCMKDNNQGTCKSKGHKKAPGSPCNNYLGYCDILNKCRKVDAEGPLSRLKNFIFSKQTFDSIYTWMTEKWWACILIGIGLILFMAGFIRVCSVHTPSNNPNLPQARQMTLPRTISRRNKRGPPTAPPIAPHEEPLPSYDTAMRQSRPAGRPAGRHQAQVSHAMQDRY